MQHPSITLIASAILLSISTAWAATPIPLPTDRPRHPGQLPMPEVLPVPIPEPPHHQVRQPAPANNPIPMPEPPRDPGQRPVPATNPLPLP